MRVSFDLRIERRYVRGEGVVPCFAESERAGGGIPLPPPYVAEVSSRIIDLRGDPEGMWLILYVVTGMIWETKGLGQGIGSGE
jgi:hypothetical protein